MHINNKDIIHAENFIFIGIMSIQVSLCFYEEKSIYVFSHLYVLIETMLGIFSFITMLFVYFIFSLQSILMHKCTIKN